LNFQSVLLHLIGPTDSFTSPIHYVRVLPEPNPTSSLAEGVGLGSGGASYPEAASLVSDLHGRTVLESVGPATI